jgi:phenylacetate-coenzyme A ligase PaaK-like adenylate-forming protein
VNPTWREIQRWPARRQRELQDHLLARRVQEYLYPFSPHYRELFDRHGIRPERIRTVADLRRVPFSRKQDLLPTPEDPQRFRKFVLQPDPASIKRAWPLGRKLRLLVESWLHGKAAVRQRLRREFYPCFMTFTTGRSAEPLPFFYSPHDLALLHESGRRLTEVIGVDQEARVANLFPYAPHLAFWQVVFAGFETGMMILSTGGGRVMGSAGDLRAAGRIRAEVLLGVPGYIYHLLRRGAAESCDLSSVKLVVLGAERVPPGLKEKVRRMLAEMGAKDPKVIGTYGFTEARMAFAECPTEVGVYSGYHLSPDLAIFEVVDPVTGEVVPDGAPGELVFTPLEGRASSVFRYRTGDRVRGGLHWEPCPHCGRTVPRIDSDITRESSVKDLRLELKIKGTLVNLEDCAQVLGDCADVEEWQVELRKKDDDPLEVDELVVHLALRDGACADAARARIHDAFRGRMEIAPNRIEVQALDAMLRRLGMETEMKEKRFLDARPKP